MTINLFQIFLKVKPIFFIPFLLIKTPKNRRINWIKRFLFCVLKPKRNKKIFE